MDLLGPILHALGEGSPWLGLLASNLLWLAAFVRALAAGRLHLREQCEARFQSMQERLQEKDRYIQQRDDRAERWERVALANTETAARSAAVVEKAVAKVISPADGKDS